MMDLQVRTTGIYTKGGLHREIAGQSSVNQITIFYWGSLINLVLFILLTIIYLLYPLLSFVTTFLFNRVLALWHLTEWATVIYMERMEVRVLFVAQPYLRSMNYLQPSRVPSLSYNSSPSNSLWVTRVALMYVLGQGRIYCSSFLPEHVGAFGSCAGNSSFSLNNFFNLGEAARRHE